jgi:Matrixin/Calx-beta domain
MSHARKRSYRPTLEGLEERIVPYTLSGFQWANDNISASFMRDGTTDGAAGGSNLFASLKRDGLSLANWQLQYARALQTWADVTPLNFHFVSDDGLPANTLRTPTQGDPDFGDIRYGGAFMGGVSYTYLPYGGPLAGCSFLATDVTWGTSGSPGTYNDLYSIILHESGHALGLYCSTDPNAVMFQYVGTFAGLAPDDIAGIQAIYGASPPDPMGQSFATATPLTLDSTGAATVSARLSSVSDMDYYQVTTPASGFDGTMSVSVDARNLSLLDPQVAVYNAAGNLLATFSAATYGSVATVGLGGLSPGQTYYLVASGARPALLSSNDANVFGMGAYTLNAQFGGVTLPSLAIYSVAVTPPNSGTKQVLFTAALSAPSSVPVTVNYATADGTAVAGRGYVAASGTLTFAPGQTRRSIAVTVDGAATYEPTETFDVVLSNATNATLGVAQGTGTIVNDHPAPPLAANSITATATATAAAANLGQLTGLNLTGLTICTATNVQWLEFVAPNSGTFTVSATFAQVGGTGGYFGMQLWNASRTVHIGGGRSATGEETFTVKLVAGRTYDLRLASPIRSLFTFDLAIVPSSGGPAR